MRQRLGILLLKAGIALKRWARSVLAGTEGYCPHGFLDVRTPDGGVDYDRGCGTCYYLQNQRLERHLEGGGSLAEFALEA